MSRVVVITGASSGIGASLARQLGEQGDSLVLGARRRDRLEKAARAAHPSAVTVVTDVTKRADVENLRDKAIESFGHIDVWVNNAGRGIKKSVQILTDEDVDAILDVNLKSAIYGMQAILPHFKERGTGHIVNISSMLSRVPYVTFRSIYSAAKSALNTLTANLRMELRETHPGINVSLVMPGPVATEFAATVIGATPGTKMTPPPGVVIQTADEVAACIVDVLAHPVAEVYTNPDHPDVARRYFTDVAAFEDDLAVQRGQPRPPIP